MLLLQHQKEVLSKSIDKNQYGYFMDMGTGKTRIVLDMIYFKCFFKVLIVIRKDDFFTWQKEVEKFTDYIYTRVNGRAELNGDSRLYFVNYDRFKTFKKHIYDIDFDCIVLDEASKIKHIDSQRFKAIYKYSRNIPNRYIMTGTPSTNRLSDIFGLIKFLDDGERFSMSKYKFTEEYYERVDKWAWQLKPNSVQKIKGKISNISFTKKLGDCIEMPQQIFITKYADMSPQQKRFYDMVDDWEIQYKGNTHYIEFAVSKMIKMLQISSGFLYDEDHVLNFTSDKQKLFIETVQEDLQDKNKIVIWCNFIEEFSILEKLINKYKLGNYVLYAGKNKQQAREQFLRNPSIRFFIGQEQSGIGMNELVVADTTIYFSNSWKLEARLQSQGRTWRIGSHMHKNILYIDMITKNSIDEKVLECLQLNKNILDLLMENPEKIFNRR